MATTTTLLQYPLHNQQHPLELRDFRNDLNPPLCRLCDWKISAYGYACLECKFYAHEACAEAPPQIYPHPLHTSHPLTLIHCLPPSINNVCDLCGCNHDSLFSCNVCDFDLDIRCALSTLSDRGGSQRKTSEQIKLPLHIHTLTSFSTRHDFIGDSNCVICKASVEGDGYACLHRECEFIIHERCIQGLYYLSSVSKTTSSSSSRATTTTLLQHPLHNQHHFLESWDLSNDSIPSICRLCNWKISADGYACHTCGFYAHRACAEAPPRIDPHPLHTDHTLTLIHRPPPYRCDACGEDFPYTVSSFRCSFRCDDCDFNLDIRCALSTLTDRGGTQGKTPEQIELPLHPHKLTSFSTRHDFIEDSNCVICKARVKGDGYACLHRLCHFLIHMRCIQDLYYTDGTKAPQFYHGHPLETFFGGDRRLSRCVTFLGEDKHSSRCVNCRSKTSLGEFIGCEECQVFYCRNCVQVPESIQYPHHPDHTLVLLIRPLDNYMSPCDSCLGYWEDVLWYGCPSCEFFVDMTCALQVLAYCGEGMSTKIELSWHEHQLHLCHRTEYRRHDCSFCEDKCAGPMYTCKEKGCDILLHKRCTEIESTIIHPHHPDHPLTLGNKTAMKNCEACSEKIDFSGFSCELCAFYLHAKCAARFPTRKHSLHEHELLHLYYADSWKCNRCGTSIDSPFFRCVSCDFNLHEKCMDLPLQVVNSEVHWHPLTLHETYIEDDSGEYYCDKCEKSRDVRFGAYVCLQCSARWAYHIECVFPELRTFFEEQSQTSIIRRVQKRIAGKNEEVRAAKVKLKGMKRQLDQLIKELDELFKERDELISGEEHYETSTDESEQEESD